MTSGLTQVHGLTAVDALVTPATTTSIPENFSTIDSALSYFAKVPLESNIEYVVSLPAGTYALEDQEYSGNIGNVLFTGSKLSIRITSVASSTGSSGSYSVVLNVNASDIGNVASGDYVGFTVTSGGTRPELLLGTFLVTAKNANTITVSLLTKSSVAAPSGNVVVGSGSGWVYKTIVTIDEGFSVTNGGAVTFDSVLFLGTIPFTSTLFVSKNASFEARNSCGFYSMDGGLSATLGGFLNADAGTMGRFGGSSAFAAAYQGSIHIDNFAYGNSSDVATYLLAADDQSEISAWTMLASGFQTGAYAQKNSSITLNGSFFYNGTTGGSAVGRGFIDATGVTMAGSVTTAYSPILNRTGIDGGYISSNDYTPSNNYISEIITATVTSGNALALTTATSKTVTSISLTAGTWVLRGQVDYVLTAATSTLFQSGFSLTTDTLPTQTGGSGLGTDPITSIPLITTLLSATYGQVIKETTLIIGATTTIYLVGQQTFSAGSSSAYGTITAIRVV